MRGTVTISDISALAEPGAGSAFGKPHRGPAQLPPLSWHDLCGGGGGGGWCWRGAASAGGGLPATPASPIRGAGEMPGTLATCRHRRGPPHLFFGGGGGSDPVSVPLHASKPRINSPAAWPDGEARSPPRCHGSFLAEKNPFFLHFSPSSSQQSAGFWGRGWIRPPPPPISPSSPGPQNHCFFPRIWGLGASHPVAPSSAEQHRKLFPPPHPPPNLASGGGFLPTGRGTPRA